MIKKTILILVVLFLAFTYNALAQDGATTTGTTTATEADTQDVAQDYKQTLIDFTQINPDTDDRLSMQFGAELSLTLPADEIKDLPPINYGLKNWKVMPSSSINIPSFVAGSEARGVPVQAGKFEGETVLGVKVLFPDYNFDMFIQVVPPFAPNTNNTAFINNGVLTNVGVVKSAYITMYGLYQPEKVYVLTEDEDGTEYQYPFGSLDFIGWRTIEWINPDYIENVRSRELNVGPLYPRETTKRLFKSIMIQRSALNETTDFVTYVRDISLTYDKALNEDLFNDIANEETWHIVEDSVKKRNQVQLRKTTFEKYFEYLTERKQYHSPKSTATNAGATAEVNNAGGGQ